jgi:hypothetical protein
MTPVSTLRMKKKTLMQKSTLWFVGGSLVAHLAYAQDHSGIAEPTLPLEVTPTVDMPTTVTAAPRRMLHHWSRVGALSDDQKSLREMLTEHPELQTHSHSTYYSWSLHVGERARHPRGSDFAHLGGAGVALPGGRQLRPFKTEMNPPGPYPS